MTVFKFYNPVQAHKELAEKLWPELKANLIAGRQMQADLSAITRSQPQNMRLHATLTEISKQIEWAGKNRDVDTWKRLTMAAWMRARGDALEILPAIDGYGVDIVFAKTSKLDRAECAELTTYVEAWGSNAGVIWSGK